MPTVLNLADIEKKSKILDIVKAEFIPKSKANKDAIIKLLCNNNEYVYIKDKIFLIKSKEFISKVNFNKVSGLHEFKYNCDDRKLSILDLKFSKIVLEGIEIAQILFILAFFADMKDHKEYMVETILNIIELKDNGYFLVDKMIKLNLKNATGNKKMYFQFLELFTPLYTVYLNKYIHNNDKIDSLIYDHLDYYNNTTNVQCYYNDNTSDTIIKDLLHLTPKKMIELIRTLDVISKKLKFISIGLLLSNLTLFVVSVASNQC